MFDHAQLQLLWYVSYLKGGFFAANGPQAWHYPFNFVTYLGGIEIFAQSKVNISHIHVTGTRENKV